MRCETEEQFAQWFHDATGHAPYPFQIRFACGDWLRNAVPVPGYINPSPLAGEGWGEGVLVDVPTGLGKTAMAGLGWLWRRQFHPDEAVQREPRIGRWVGRKLSRETNQL